MWAHYLHPHYWRNENDSTFLFAPAYLKEMLQLDSETASRNTEAHLRDVRDTCSSDFGSCWKGAASVFNVAFWRDDSSAEGLSQLLSSKK